MFYQQFTIKKNWTLIDVVLPTIYHKKNWTLIRIRFFQSQDNEITFKSTKIF